jgi:16S rRNA (uracil1498-N3)-methyltransferase
VQHIPRLHVSGRLGSGPVVVDGEQAKRLAKVMRAHEGDEVRLFNGDGREWRCEVTTVERQRVILRVGEVMRQAAAAPLIVETWCGLIRPQRFDWMVEKATEAGTDIIRPFLSARTMGTREASKGRMERWERLAVEASEQCGRLHLPVIEQPGALLRMLETYRGALVIADVRGDGLEAVSRLLPLEGHVAVVIGPEGGFTEAELESARMRGALRLRLGPHVLRTETAAIVATAMLSGLRWPG